ncbi:MAG: glycerate kinase [Bacteroidota bacterium]
MKIIIAPDKFKGSLTAFDVCKAISAGINNIDKKTETLSFPMADGGDGFATVMQYYLQTESIYCDTVDPLRRKINASYQWNKKTKTAIIEMAVASGLVLLKEEERNPLLASTYGTGLLIKDAVARGAKKIVLGLGGSATNDGGTGILEALGFDLLDSDDNIVGGNGGSLGKIERVVAPVLPAVKFEIACDVKNVLCGEQGASFIYGPQKGADTTQVKFLDDGMKKLADVLVALTGKEVADIKGAGAAGGIVLSLMSFFDVELRQGIDMILSVSGIDKQVKDADLVITGEGKIDLQSSEGKVIGSIAQLANENKIPVIAFCGRLDLNEEEIKKLGLTKAFTIGKEISPEESMRNAEKLLEQKAEEVISSFIHRN